MAFKNSVSDNDLRGNWWSHDTMNYSWNAKLIFLIWGRLGQDVWVQYWDRNCKCSFLDIYTQTWNSQLLMLRLIQESLTILLSRLLLYRTKEFCLRLKNKLKDLKNWCWDPEMWYMDTETSNSCDIKMISIVSSISDFGKLEMSSL